MRKIASLLVAAALVGTVSVSAMAADINEAEQAVLNELNGSVIMKGQKLVISEEYKNQAKNYFNTIDMTQEQSDNIVAELKKAEQLITEQGSDAGNIPEMLYAKKRELLTLGQNMAGEVGLTMSWNAATKEIIIADADSTVLFQGEPVFVTEQTETPTGTTPTGTTPTGTPGGNSGSGTTGGNTSGSGTTGGNTSGGTTSGGTTGKIADGNAVKTTGAGVDTSAVAGASAVAVLAAAAGAVYAVKSRKERA